jgi:hypothetical protein
MLRHLAPRVQGKTARKGIRYDPRASWIVPGNLYTLEVWQNHASIERLFECPYTLTIHMQTLSLYPMLSQLNFNGGEGKEGQKHEARTIFLSLRCEYGSKSVFRSTRVSF